MNIEYPSEPKPNEELRADWGRQVVRCLRRLTPIQSPGERLNFTPYGVSRRVERGRVSLTGAVSLPAGCFAIESYRASEDSEPYSAIVNRYYRIGHTIGEMSFSAPPEVPWGCDADHPILAIVASADQSAVTVEVERFADMSALIQRSKDYDSAVIPLYQFKFDAEGEYVGIEIDFRNMPAFTITEDGL